MSDRPPMRACRHVGLGSLVALLLFVPAAGATSTGASGVSPALGGRGAPVASVTSHSPAATSADKRAAGVKAAAVKAVAVKAAAVKAAAVKAAAVKAAAENAAAKRKAAKAARPLLGWLASTGKFPHRELVLSAPQGTVLSTGQVHVSENGVPVSSPTLTPATLAGPSGIGVMFVVDQNSSMSGAPTAAVMSAIRGFAAERSAAQKLGLITFSATPNLVLAPTTQQGAIDTALTQNLGAGVGADVPAAVGLALSQLARAKVTLGVIVVISDGVGKLTSAAPSVASIQAAAAGAHVPIFTIGLRDSASNTGSASALKAASPGQFEPTAAAGLPGVLHSISAALLRGYVVRYVSRQHAGERVTVTAGATGVAGIVDVTYQTPAAERSAPRTPARVTSPPVRRHPGLAPAVASPLSAGPAQPLPVAASSPAAPAQGGPLPAPVLAAVFGVLIAMAITLIARRPKRAVRTRVLGSMSTARTEHGVAVQAKQGQGVLSMLERGRWWQPFVENVAVGRSSHTPVGLIKRGAAAGAVAAVLLTLVSGSPILGLAPLLLWPIALRMFVNRAARKQRDLFVSSLPAYLQDLCSALRVGRSFAGALAIVAENADEPVRSELERAVTDEKLGRPLADSLIAISVRMKSTDMDQVALVAALSSRSGSNVAEALDRVAEGARDRADMRREVKALTSQAKMSSSVLTGLPPLVLVFISFVSPSYARPLLHSTIGIILLIVAALMLLAGWKVMKKISTVKA